MKGFIENILTEQYGVQRSSGCGDADHVFEYVDTGSGFPEVSPCGHTTNSSLQSTLLSVPAVVDPWKGTSAADSVDLSSASCERHVR